MAMSQASNPIVDFIQGLTNGVQHSMSQGQGGTSPGGGSSAVSQQVDASKNRPSPDDARMPENTYIQDGKLKNTGTYAPPQTSNYTPLDKFATPNVQDVVQPDMLARHGGSGHQTFAPGSGPKAVQASKSKSKPIQGVDAKLPKGGDSSGGEGQPREQGTADQAAQGVTQSAMPHKGNIGHALGFMLHQASTGGFGPGQPQAPAGGQA